ncbi:MAG: enoyl-CoA hydratase/isomerase family protein [Sandaracinaceae bacterium]
MTPIALESTDGILHVTLQAEPLNEIGLPMLEALEAMVPRLSDGSHRALVIGSRNAKGFSAGADLRALYEGLRSLDDEGSFRSHASRLFDRKRTAARALVAAARHAVRTRERDPKRVLTVWGVRAFLDRVHRVMDAIDTAPIPTVAAVHGVCFGGGFELALTCDVIVADKTARFAFPELRLGLIPGFGGIPRLERDLGNAVVRDLVLSGRSISAKRAHEVGLVAQLVGEGHAIKVASRLADQMSRFDPTVSAVAKRFTKPLPVARLRRERDRFCERLGSPVVMEALRRFVESTDAMPYLPARPSERPSAAPPDEVRA